LSEGVRGRIEPLPVVEETPKDRVDAVDVLDMHAFLEGFEGDFKSLFRSPGGRSEP